MQFDKHGRELPDNTPIALPLGFKIPETLAEQIQRLIRNQVSVAASEGGAETFAESDDFDIDEDEDPQSPYEMTFDPVLGREVSVEMLVNDQNIKKEYVEKAASSDEALDAATEAKNRAGGVPPEPNPPNPVADTKKEKPPKDL